MVTCPYCRQSNSEKEYTCNYCGGRLHESKGVEPTSQPRVGEPFFYQGYIVWCVTDGPRDIVQYVFYHGAECVEVLEFHRRFFEELAKDGPGVDHFDYVWHLFCVKQGLEESHTWEYPNSRYRVVIIREEVEPPSEVMESLGEYQDWKKVLHSVSKR